MKVSCVACKHQYEIKDAMVERPAPALGADVTEYALKCPLCGNTVHTHYANDATRGRQELVRISTESYQRQPTPGRLQRLQQAKDDLKREHDKLNPRPVVGEAKKKALP